MTVNVMHILTIALHYMCAVSHLQLSWGIVPYIKCASPLKPGNLIHTKVQT